MVHFLSLKLDSGLHLRHGHEDCLGLEAPHARVFFHAAVHEVAVAEAFGLVLVQKTRHDVLGTPQTRLGRAQFPFAPQPLSIHLGIGLATPASGALVHVPGFEAPLA